MKDKSRAVKVKLKCITWTKSPKPTLEKSLKRKINKCGFVFSNCKWIVSEFPNSINNDDINRILRLVPGLSLNGWRSPLRSSASNQRESPTSRGVCSQHSASLVQTKLRRVALMRRRQQQQRRTRLYCRCAQSPNDISEC